MAVLFLKKIKKKCHQKYCLTQISTLLIYRHKDLSFYITEIVFPGINFSKISINIFFRKKIVIVLADHVKKYRRQALQNTAEKCSS